jgi:hypothetical protein
MSIVSSLGSASCFLPEASECLLQHTHIYNMDILESGERQVLEQFAT